MASKTPKRKQSAQRMKNGAPPVVEDAKLRRMGEGEPEPVRIGGRMSLMAEEPKRDEGTRNRMAPFRHVKSPAETRMPKGGYPEQEPPKPPRRKKPAGRASKQAKEGYVRLRVLVQDGELSVVGAKFVEGPLAPMETLHPGLAYEMTLGARRVAAGAIADAGVWRSYPDPLGRVGDARAPHHRSAELRDRRQSAGAGALDVRAAEGAHHALSLARHGPRGARRRPIVESAVEGARGDGRDAERDPHEPAVEGSAGGGEAGVGVAAASSMASRITRSSGALAQSSGSKIITPHSPKAKSLLGSHGLYQNHARRAAASVFVSQACFAQRGHRGPRP